MWKKRNLLLFVIFSTLVVLAACGQASGDSKQDVTEINLDPLNVEIIAPEEIDPNTEHILQAFVTQGEEKVNDASKVEFEVWQQEEKEESELIEAELTDEDGVYEISYHFIDENVYYVQPHVTARGMHMMPVQAIKVGDAPEIVEEEYEWEEMDMEDMDGHNNH